MRILPLSHYLPTLKGLFHNFIHREAVYPFYASFKVTSRCHFACPFCNVKNDRLPDLPTESVKKILDNLSRSPVLMTSFEGGEPLLRGDIGELLHYARERCRFYLLFTTSVKTILDYPLEEYGPCIDFFHISIDEGHANMELYGALPELVRRLPSQVSVQVVVTRQTIGGLEEKVKRCFDAGAAIVVIPATHMDDTEDFFPDISELEAAVSALRKNYPNTIHTPQGYFRALREGRCSSASIIIAPDGRVYYPCHIRATKGPSLVSTDLSEWLHTREAKVLRGHMKTCKRNCGWYQYYSIESYTSIASVFDALGPMLFQKRQKANQSLRS
ncbi:MAG TPA: radical SAM protein [Chitinivibrionales bacterium]|nr:radical SAM protein [Chitinivibrionales bacterium]